MDAHKWLPLLTDQISSKLKTDVQLFYWRLFVCGWLEKLAKHTSGRWKEWHAEQGQYPEKLNKCQFGGRLELSISIKIAHCPGGVVVVWIPAPTDAACRSILHLAVIAPGWVSVCFLFAIHEFRYDELTVRGDLASTTVWEYKSETFIIYFLLVIAVGISSINITRIVDDRPCLRRGLIRKG